MIERLYLVDSGSVNFMKGKILAAIFLCGMIFHFAGIASGAEISITSAPARRAHKTGSGDR